MNSIESVHLKPQPHKVIAMVIWANKSNLLWGAVRNAQLRHVYYPGWTLRVYILKEGTLDQTRQHSLYFHETETAKNLFTYQEIIKTLSLFDVDVRFIEKDIWSQLVHGSLINLLALDDTDLDTVLLRNADQRFSQK